MEAIRKKCGYQFGIDIGVDVSRGGLSLGWKEDFSVTLKSFSKSHIDVEIEEDNVGFKWRFIGFYGSLMENLRKDSWNQIKKLKGGNNLP